MKPLTLGPIELTIVALGSERTSLGFLAPLAAQVDAGTVRLVDIVLIERSTDGAVSINELDVQDLGIAGLEALAPGLAGYEDLDVLAELVPAGTAAAIIALEPAWSRVLAAELARSGVRVIGTERIPAVVANTILDIAAEDRNSFD